MNKNLRKKYQRGRPNWRESPWKEFNKNIGSNKSNLCAINYWLALCPHWVQMLFDLQWVSKEWWYCTQRTLFYSRRVCMVTVCMSERVYMSEWMMSIQCACAEHSYMVALRLCRALSDAYGRETAVWYECIFTLCKWIDYCFCCCVDGFVCSYEWVCGYVCDWMYTE